MSPSVSSYERKPVRNNPDPTNAGLGKSNACVLTAVSTSVLSYTTDRKELDLEWDRAYTDVRTLVVNGVHIRLDVPPLRTKACETATLQTHAFNVRTALLRWTGQTDSPHAKRAYNQVA